MIWFRLENYEVFYVANFLRNPFMPSRPEPKSRAVSEMGTGEDGGVARRR